MRTPATGILAASALVLAGCGGDGGYPDSARQSFMRQCQRESRATLATCGCVLEELERTMPYDEFARADKALRNDRAPDADSARKPQDAVSRCLTRASAVGGS